MISYKRDGRLENEAGLVGCKLDLRGLQRQITERTFEIGEMDRAMLSGLMELLCCGISDVMDVVDQVIDGINRFQRGSALLQERLQARCHSRIRFRLRRGQRLDGRGNLRGLKITVGFVASQQCDQIGEFRVGHVRFASPRGSKSSSLA